MASILNFASTSQAFVAAYTVMAQQMTRTEAIHAQIQEHLSLPPIPLTPPTAAAPASSTVSPVVASTDPAPTTSADPTLIASTVHSTIVPPGTSAALLADHPSVPTQSQDEDEIPPPTAT